MSNLRVLDIREIFIQRILLECEENMLKPSAFGLHFGMSDKGRQLHFPDKPIISPGG